MCYYGHMLLAGRLLMAVLCAACSCLKNVFSVQKYNIFLRVYHQNKNIHDFLARKGI